jgi:hypothetical protein
VSVRLRDSEVKVKLTALAEFVVGCWSL